MNVNFLFLLLASLLVRSFGCSELFNAVAWMNKKVAKMREERTTFFVFDGHKTYECQQNNWVFESIVCWWSILISASFFLYDLLISSPSFSLVSVNDDFASIFLMAQKAFTEIAIAFRAIEKAAKETSKARRNETSPTFYSHHDFDVTKSAQNTRMNWNHLFTYFFSLAIWAQHIHTKTMSNSKQSVFSWISGKKEMRKTLSVLMMRLWSLEERKNILFLFNFFLELTTNEIQCWTNESNENGKILGNLKQKDWKKEKVIELIAQNLVSRTHKMAEVVFLERFFVLSLFKIWFFQRETIRMVLVVLSANSINPEHFLLLMFRVLCSKHLCACEKFHFCATKTFEPEMSISSDPNNRNVTLSLWMCTLIHLVVNFVALYFPNANQSQTQVSNWILVHFCLFDFHEAKSIECWMRHSICQQLLRAHLYTRSISVTTHSSVMRMKWTSAFARFFRREKVFSLFFLRQLDSNKLNFPVHFCSQSTLTLLFFFFYSFSVLAIRICNCKKASQQKRKTECTNESESANERERKRVKKRKMAK